MNLAMTINVVTVIIIADEVVNTIESEMQSIVELERYRLIVGFPNGEWRMSQLFKVLFKDLNPGIAMAIVRLKIPRKR